jgi:GNAT superfamily N-acetyltransferase
VGYLFVTKHRGVYTVQRLAVAEPWRRRGCGTLLVGNLVSTMRISGGKKRTAYVIVSDLLTDVHLFLKSQGFFVKYVNREHFRTNSDCRDGYFFERTVV